MIIDTPPSTFDRIVPILTLIVSILLLCVITASAVHVYYQKTNFVEVRPTCEKSPDIIAIDPVAD